MKLLKIHDKYINTQQLSHISIAPELDNSITFYTSVASFTVQSPSIEASKQLIFDIMLGDYECLDVMKELENETR